MMCHTLKLVALFPFSMIFEIMVYFTIDGVLGSTKYCISRSPAHHVKTPYPFPKDVLQAQRSIAAVGGEVTKPEEIPIQQEREMIYPLSCLRTSNIQKEGMTCELHTFGKWHIAASRSHLFHQVTCF